MNAVRRTVALAIAALATIAVPLEADAGPYGGRGGYSRGGWGHGGHGRHWGGVGLGIGIGLGGYYALSPWSPWYYPAYGYPVAVPAPVYEVVSPPPAPVAKSAPDPIVYPNQGQSAAQTEADRQACNRWAMGQPSAVADASVFHRATLACLEGRGYTVK